MARFAIRIVCHAGSSGPYVFGDIAESLQLGLQELGHQASVAEINSGGKWTAGATNIVIGAFQLCAPRPPVIQETMPDDAILVQTEPFMPGCSWFSPAYISMLRQHPVWEYDPGNFERLLLDGINAKFLPFAVHPKHAGVTQNRPDRARDWDAVFLGAAAGRRRVIAQQMRTAGLNVQTPPRAFLDQRDAAYGRSKVVLNLHFHEGPAPLEAARLSYAAAFGAAIVSERSWRPEEDAKWTEAGVVFADRDKIVDETVALVRDRGRRDALRQRGIDWTKARWAGWKEQLREAVGISMPRRPTTTTSELGVVVLERNWMYRVFDEIAVALSESLRELGLGGHLQTLKRGSPSPKGPVVIIGANTILHGAGSPFAPGSIIYQTEQMFPGSPWRRPDYLSFLKRHAVWDYSEKNATWLRELGVSSVTHVPLGHVQKWESFRTREPYEYDVAFFGGCAKGPRKPMVDALVAHGLRVLAGKVAWGAERNALYARSKVALNLASYIPGCFEAARVHPLLANGCCVVSESRGDASEKDYGDAVAFASRDRLAAVVVEHVQNDALRQKRAEAALAWMRARPMKDYVAKALGITAAHRRTKVFITARDRLSMLPGMVKDILRMGGEPIIVDNDSTYPPLLAWYATKPCEIIFLRENLGGEAVWKRGMVGQLGELIVSDGDLDLSGCPDDTIAVLRAAVARHPHVRKAGLSLRIDDLPDTPWGKKVHGWEDRYWTRRASDGFYLAPIGHTFALYRRDREHCNFFSAVRAPPPYMARHPSWYEDPSHGLSEESQYYYARARVLPGKGFASGIDAANAAANAIRSAP